MKNLTLSIKQVYFDEILAGTKKIETREIRPKNVKKYCEVDENNEVFYDENDKIKTKKYDTIKFLTGAYVGTRLRMVVECLGSEVFILEDENGEEFIYEENGIEYVESQIDFHLGKILNKP